MHWCKWPLWNSCCWLVLAFPLTCLFKMTTPCRTITHKHCSYSILKQLCRIKLVLGGSTCICTYTCTSTCQCACAAHIVHLTFVHALCKLALLIALALDYAVAMRTGTWHLHLHLYLHLASWQCARAPCTSTCTSTWVCTRTGTWPKWLVWPHGSLMARALGPVLFPYLQTFSLQLPMRLIYCLKNISLAIVLLLDDLVCNHRSRLPKILNN